MDYHEFRMTPEEFEEYIQHHKSIPGVHYLANKDLFDKAERDGKLVIKRESSQITDGIKVHPQFYEYRWD